MQGEHHAVATGPRLRVESFWRRPLVLSALVVCSAALLGCSVRTRRATDIGAGAMDAGATSRADAPSERATCERLDVPATREVPNVLVLLDRSQSMFGYDPDTEADVDRWTPAVAAVDSVARAFEHEMKLGLALFPALVGDAVCAPAEVLLAPALDRASDIATALSGSAEDSVGGNTPTAESLAIAGDALGGLAGPSYVLLVTDGGPNCNTSLRGATCRCTFGPDCRGQPILCLDDERSIDAVAELAAAGIGTFVVGYDTASWADVLDRMAEAGGTSVDRHVPVHDGASLEAALREISGGVVSCSFELTMPPGDYRFVRVTVDGEDVAHASTTGGASGWALEGDRRVVLLGEDCERLRDGRDHSVGIVVECTPVII